MRDTSRFYSLEMKLNLHIMQKWEKNVMFSKDASLAAEFGWVSSIHKPVTHAW